MPVVLIGGRAAVASTSSWIPFPRKDLNGVQGQTPVVANGDGVDRCGRPEELKSGSPSKFDLEDPLLGCRDAGREGRELWADLGGQRRFHRPPGHGIAGAAGALGTAAVRALRVTSLPLEGTARSGLAIMLSGGARPRRRGPRVTLQ
jgi:hypothetical protein